MEFAEESSGYRLMKLCPPVDQIDYEKAEMRWPAMTPVCRLAEIYYMLAECYYNMDRKGDAAELINKVRARNFADGKDPNPVTAANLDKYRLADEWMIEFLGEGKRYYDLRRWMDAPIEESKPVYGCNVLMTANQKDEFQQVVPIYNLPTVFTEKMYFWPISTDELKRNRNLVQNPGWKYFD